MSVLKHNTKKFNDRDELRCNCGSIRFTIKIFPDDDGERRWIEVCCKKCNKLLFYNGA